MKPLRNKYGKKRWEDTPLAKPYKRRKALAYPTLAMIARMAQVQVGMIAAQEANTPEAKARKHIAICDAVVAAQNAIAKESERLLEGNFGRKR